MDLLLEAVGIKMTENNGTVDVKKEEESEKEVMSELDVEPNGEMRSASDENEVASLYSERTRKRRYKTKKEKALKPEQSGRSWTKLEDPNAPRKPRSAYVHFLSARRAHYGTVKQGCDQKSINVALAADWQALSPEDRQPYQDQALKERTEYQREMVNYQKTESYAVFMQKKELIMRQRKQCRKMGVESDSFIENLVLNQSAASSSEYSPVKKGSKKKNVNMDDFAFTVPLIPNTDIPIFHNDFIGYNKERETQLRLIRNAIRVAEGEQSAMKSTIDRVEVNHSALTAQVEEDERAIHEANAMMTLWMQLVGAAMQKANISPALPTSPMDAVELLSGLAAANDDQSKATRQALHSISFPATPAK